MQHSGRENIKHLPVLYKKSPTTAHLIPWKQSNHGNWVALRNMTQYEFMEVKYDGMNVKNEVCDGHYEVAMGSMMWLG